MNINNFTDPRVYRSVSIFGDIDHYCGCLFTFMALYLHVFSKYKSIVTHAYHYKSVLIVGDHSKVIIVSGQADTRVSIVTPFERVARLIKFKHKHNR